MTCSEINVVLINKFFMVAVWMVSAWCTGSEYPIRIVVKKMCQSGQLDLLDVFYIKFMQFIQIGHECSLIICWAFSRLLSGKVK